MSPVSPSLLFWKFLDPLRAAERRQHKSTRAGCEIEDTGASVKPGVVPEGKVILTQPFFLYPWGEGGLISRLPERKVEVELKVMNGWKVPAL